MLKRLLTSFVALLLGAAMPLAFLPHGWYPIAPLTAAGLLWLWIKAPNPREALRIGWLFGMGLFGIGVSWIYISLHNFGGINLPVSYLLTSWFVIILALFPALQGYCLTQFFDKKHLSTFLFVFPTTWLLFEWLRGWMFTGFPWLWIGYSQTNSPLRGYAPIFGVYGVSWVTALSAGCLAGCILFRHTKRYACLVLLLLIWCVGGLLQTIHWTQPIGKSITVSLVQGNIPQQLKWNPTEILPTLKKYRTLTDKHWNSQLIIWPEGAVPLSLQSAKFFLQPLSQQAHQHHTSIILGLPIAAPQYGAYYNGAIAIGRGSGQYVKRHLVPFGEYLPWPKLLQSVTKILQIPTPMFISGPHKQPLLTTPFSKIGLFICYEVAYPHLVRSYFPAAQALITISDDAWFGTSWASWQHLQMGQMAALETGRYMLFVSNNGVTAIIAPNGHVVKMLPRFKTGVLTGKIRAMKHLTPWVKWG